MLKDKIEVSVILDLVFNIECVDIWELLELILRNVELYLPFLFVFLNTMSKRFQIYGTIGLDTMVIAIYSMIFTPFVMAFSRLKDLIVSYERMVEI